MKNKYLLLTVLLIGALLIVNLPEVSADVDDDDDHCGGDDRAYWMFPMMFMGGLAVVFVLFLVLKDDGTLRHGHQTNPSNNSLAVLDERYARGEIPQEEYLRMKEDLRR